MGLINGQVDGLKINYCLCGSAIADFKLAFNDFFKDADSKEFACK